MARRIRDELLGRGAADFLFGKIRRRDWRVRRPSSARYGVDFVAARFARLWTWWYVAAAELIT